MPQDLRLHLSRVFVALLLAAASTTAEELTLAGALARARASAPDVAAAQARAEAGEARLDEARSYRRPSFSLSEIWMRTDSPAEAFALQLNQERFSFADFVASDPNDPDTIESATTRVEASLPVYTGGELSSRIEQATRAANAGRQQALAVSDAAALAAAEAYIGLAQAREHVTLMERSLETVSAHVDLARAYTEQGMVVRSELLRAEVEQARIEDLLATAAGRARVAAANLSFRLAARPDGEWQLTPLPDPWPVDESIDRWLASAESRPDLLAARTMLEAAELEIKVRRAGRLPRIGLVARHDLVDDSLFGDHGDSTAIMAVGRIELWTGGRHRAATDAATADFEAGRREVEQFADAVRLEITDAFERAVTAVERYHTAVSALGAAREAERITEERFKQGVVKMLDVLDAATARREAELRELVARADAHLDRLRLAVTAGRRPEDYLVRTASREPLAATEHSEEHGR